MSIFATTEDANPLRRHFLMPRHQVDQVVISLAAEIAGGVIKRRLVRSHGHLWGTNVSDTSVTISGEELHAHLIEMPPPVSEPSHRRYPLAADVASEH